MNDDKTATINRVLDHLYQVNEIVDALKKINLPPDTIAYTVPPKDYDDIRKYLEGISTDNKRDEFQKKTVIAGSGNFLFYNCILVVEDPQAFSIEPNDQLSERKSNITNINHKAGSLLNMVDGLRNEVVDGKINGLLFLTSGESSEGFQYGWEGEIVNDSFRVAGMLTWLSGRFLAAINTAKKP